LGLLLVGKEEMPSLKVLVFEKESTQLLSMRRRGSSRTKKDVLDLRRLNRIKGHTQKGSYAGDQSGSGK